MNNTNSTGQPAATSGLAVATGSDFRFQPMKKHIVIAYFLKPHGDPFAAKEMELDWNDRASVRDFARQSDEWLCKEKGNRVLTETKELP